MCAPPALTAVNLPGGGVARPPPPSPQQVAVPSVLTPQVCAVPALTEVNVPGGGVARPLSSLPQQRTEPPVVTAHVWRVLALTEANDAGGSVVSTECASSAPPGLGVGFGGSPARPGVPCSPGVLAGASGREPGSGEQAAASASTVTRASGPAHRRRWGRSDAIAPLPLPPAGGSIGVPASGLGEAATHGRGTLAGGRASCVRAGSGSAPVRIRERFRVRCRRGRERGLPSVRFRAWDGPWALR